jgi:hypothetical protein
MRLALALLARTTKTSARTHCPSREKQRWQSINTLRTETGRSRRDESIVSRGMYCLRDGASLDGTGGGAPPRNVGGTEIQGSSDLDLSLLESQLGVESLRVRSQSIPSFDFRLDPAMYSLASIGTQLRPRQYRHPPVRLAPRAGLGFCGETAVRLKAAGNDRAATRSLGGPRLGRCRLRGALRAEGGTKSSGRRRIDVLRSICGVLLPRILEGRAADMMSRTRLSINLQTISARR